MVMTHDTLVVTASHHAKVSGPKMERVLKPIRL